MDPETAKILIESIQAEIAQLHSLIPNLEGQLKDKNIAPETKKTIAKQHADAQARVTLLRADLAKVNNKELPLGTYNIAALKAAAAPAPGAKIEAPKTPEEKKALKDLLDKLEELNGLEVYSPASSPDAPLIGDKRMMLPIGVLTSVVTNDVKKIGLHASSALDSNMILRIAAVNFTSLKAANHPFPTIVSLLRAMIAMRQFAINEDISALVINDDVSGRYCLKKEIKIVAESEFLNVNPAGQIIGVGRELFELGEELAKQSIETLQAMSILLPMYASVEFQKTNHHYIDDDIYKEAYHRHFRSSLLSDLEGIFNKASVVYDSVHWLGPYNMEMWKVNTEREAAHLIPLGLKIKMYPNPSGTAVIMTQLAVWKAISVYPGTEGLMTRYATELRILNDAATEIKHDRLAYHVFSGLFNIKSKLDSDEMKKALSTASSLSAVAQGFLDAVCQGSDLGRAKALKKHADQNIALYNIAKTAFQGAQARMRREAREKDVSEVVVHAITRAQKPAIPALGAVEEEAYT